MRIGIVGSGIVGLAHAYWAHKKGHQVILFDRDSQPMGASVRNFGLIWPIGQQTGPNLDLALNSRKTWIELSEIAGFWLNKNGSLHVAYHQDEWAVLNEFADNSRQRDIQLLNPDQVKQISPYVGAGLNGGLHSLSECTVNPREAVPKLAEYLGQQSQMKIFFNEPVLEISLPTIVTSRQKIEVDQVVICSGIDYQTLFPEYFAKAPLTRCKLQMMKGIIKSPSLLGPTLCGALTLTHYAAFRDCPSLPEMSARLHREWPGYQEYGIHVMLAQNGQIEFIIGDSHQYGLNLSPFNRQEIDDLILQYLHSFTALPGLEISEKWYGVYSKLENGEAFLREKPAAGITVVTGLGGAGMTLSFGIAEKTIENL